MFENGDRGETERKKGRGVIERLCFAWPTLLAESVHCSFSGVGYLCHLT
jgi:hypothetical protein